ncbi:MAG: hypothetical protein AAGE13_15095 [Pseudomonadota bacterium]
MTDVAFEPGAAPDTDAVKDPEDAKWHHRPAGRVPLNPLFQWPPRPAAIWRWYRGAWLQITSVSIAFLVAVIAYAWFLPPLEKMATFQFGWMFTVWLLNMVPQTVIASSLHWWLYVRKGQGMETKFEARDLSRDNSLFTFRNQVWDNIWWTLGSAMTVATVYQWGVFWTMANGYVPTVTWATSPVWCVIWMAFIPMWSGLHFYWAAERGRYPYALWGDPDPG